jgi:hypothetical protein
VHVNIIGLTSSSVRYFKPGCFFLKYQFALLRKNIQLMGEAMAAL